MRDRQNPMQKQNQNQNYQSIQSKNKNKNKNKNNIQLKNNNSTKNRAKVFGWCCLIFVILFVLNNSNTVIREDSEEDLEMGNKMAKSFDAPVVMGDESMMSKKAHGTCSKPVQSDLLWNVDVKKADEICCFNRHWAEHSGYFQTKSVTWLADMKARGNEPVEYYDSVHGKLVFTAPKSRTFDEFRIESAAHGWPSFRDDEVNWDVVRVLPNGEAITVDGVHLGHNLPDRSGNRYCINLVCIAGKPEK